MKNHYIIDAHCHIYPEKIAQKATDSTDKFYGVTHAPFHGTTKELIEQSEASHKDVGSQARICSGVNK